jgi:hypothetical protein
MVWKVRVKAQDIAFSVRESISSPLGGGGSFAILEGLQRGGAGAALEGTLPPSDKAGKREINLLFDNSHSHLSKKTVVFWVAIGENVSLADDQVGAARAKEVHAANEGPPE